MGLFGTKSKGAEAVVGPDLAAVLPQNAPAWYRTKHLVILNLMLLVPLFSSATIGFDGAMMNGLQTVKQWRTYFHSPSSSLLGVMNAIYPVGKILGLFPTTYISDRYGRKTSMWIGFVLLLIGAGLQGGSVNTAMFIVSRFILGFATALIAQPSPILVSELAYPTHRAKATAMYQTFFYVGSIFAAWSTYGTFRLASTWSWRIPSILQGAIPAIQFAAAIFVPESPRWLIAHGKSEEARKILVRYHAGGDESSPLVDYEMRQIQESLRLEAEALAETTYLTLLRTGPNRRRTLIAVLVGFFAQWSGTGVVSYYITLVLNTVGITETKDQALINGLLQVWNWIAAVFAGALMIDRVGRRPLFLISAAGMLVCYVAWTILTAVFTRSLDQQTGHAVVAFIFIYYFFYDIAYAPLLMAYPVEIFPYTLRSKGVAVTYGATFIGLIIGQFVNPIAMSHIGWKYYIVFCCLLALLVLLTYLLFPETKGRTLEEIALIFDGKTSLVECGEDEKGGEDSLEVENITATKL